MPLLAIGVLAGLTYSFRLAGPVLRGRVRLSRSTEDLFAIAAAILLMSLAATGAITQGHGFAGWARPAGVLVAGVLAARKAPFPVVAIAAAATTALLRLAGIA